MDNKLFKEDITKYDLLQLENWIRRCRNEIKKENYLNSNSPGEDYKKAVLDFVEEWQEHYENNEDIYEKDDFQKAILANGINLDRIILVIQKGKKIKNIDITEKLYNSFLNDEDISMFKNIMDDYIEKKLNKIDDYFELIAGLDYIEDYKQRIVELIRNKSKYEILSYTAIIEDEMIFEIDNIEDLFDALVIDIEEEPKVFEILEKDYPFLVGLNAFDITRQVFYDFEEEAFKDSSDKFFNKKFFINTGLYLSLNFNLFEMFINLFGYTVENSRVERDRILTEFVSIGLDKEYIDISIEANRLRPLTARVAGYQKRDITFIEEFLKKSSYTIEEIKEFKFTLQYSITRLKTFIENKEGTREKVIDKYNRVEKRLDLESIKLKDATDSLELYESKNHEDEENYRIQISENRQKLYVLKKKLSTSVSEKEENKRDIKALINENKELTDMASGIKGNIMELKKFRNEQLRIFKRTEKSFTNIQNKLKNIDTIKYKSLDIFNAHIENYNDFTLSEVKDLLKQFEDLYKKDYIP